MVAPSIWGAAGARGAGRAAWGGSRPGRVGRGVGCRTEEQDGAQQWLRRSPSLRSPSSCTLLSTCAPEADLHSLSVPSKESLCGSTRVLSLPGPLCTSLPPSPPPPHPQPADSRKEQPTPFNQGLFPEDAGHGFILLSGRESRTGYATKFQGNSGQFLKISLGLGFPLCRMETLMATLLTPWGCWENLVKGCK